MTIGVRRTGTSAVESNRPRQGAVHPVGYCRRAASHAHFTRRTCASLLVALDVHPRVAILRHSKIAALTMDIYSQVSSASTREALKRLGEAFG